MKVCPKCQKLFSDDANFCPVDAARLNPAESQAQGPDGLTSRFELGAQLGGSHTGAVHRAVDKTTGKPCVVKIIAKTVVALPGVAQRLDRELKQLERVQSVGVARVLASGKRGDDTWVATELVEGATTLAQAISARGPIPSDHAAGLVEVIGEALIEAAQVGVVHRDLAPKNVLFASDEVKLINFPLPVPTTDKVPGVPEFVAPEQVDGRPVDQRSNLYSLGALYYYVLTGQTIYSGSADEVHRLHQQGSIKPPSTLGISIPPAVETVIMRALDRSPTKRFLTVRQFVDEVQRVGHTEVIELKPSEVKPPAAELKQTMAHGRAGRPKGELVQTLMGIHKGALPVQNASGATKLPAVTASATVQGQALAPTAERARGGQEVATSPGGPIAMTALTPPPMAPLVPPMAPVMPTPVAAAPQPAPPVMPAPPVVAAPVVAAPVLAAPVVGAQTVQGSPAGKKKAGDEGKGAKGKFRETMWFKKGDLDAEAAQRAAEEAARTGKAVDQDKADSLPMDERYKDDGSITRSDKEKYSLKTGATMMMSAMPDAKPRGGKKVSEDALVSEMKGGRTPILLALVFGVIAIAGIVYLVAH